MNAVPLHERGLRPDPMLRGATAVYVWQQLDRRMRLAAPYVAHEMCWGVPCGPTLSMLPGRGPRGISSLLDSPSPAELLKPLNDLWRYLGR